MKKNEKNKNERKHEQRKKANSHIFQACSDIVYCFLKNPTAELSAKDIQNRISQNMLDNHVDTDCEINLNVYRKALFYLSDSVYFLDKSSYGKYKLSESITPFSSKEILNELAIDKDKLNQIIKLIDDTNKNNNMLIIPKGDIDIDLKAQKLCSLFRGNDVSLSSDIFKSAFTDFSISNFKGLIRDTFLGVKLYNCFNSKEQLMPVLLQISKHNVGIDIDVKTNNSILKFENINIKKIEITNDNIYLKNDILNLKLNDISDIQNIKVRTFSIEKGKYTLLINKKILIESLKKDDNFFKIENLWREFAYELGFETISSYENSFLELINSSDNINVQKDDINKRSRTFISKAIKHLKISN